MKFFTTILFCIVFYTGFTQVDNLPPNAKPGECYVRCQADESGVSSWININCDILKLSRNEIKYLQNQMRDFGYPVEATGNLNIDFKFAYDDFKTRNKSKSKLSEGQLRRFNKRLAKKKEKTKGSFNMTMKGTCSFKIESENKPPLHYSCLLDDYEDDGRLEALNMKLSNLGYDVDIVNSLNVKTISAYEDYSYNRYLDTLDSE